MVYTILMNKTLSLHAISKFQLPKYLIEATPITETFIVENARRFIDNKDAIEYAKSHSINFAYYPVKVIE